MRLLERQSDWSFRLTENLFDREIPRYPYAILSHTWGQANEEVTFEDINEGSGRDKAGYKKIKFCGEQAARDGLKYFWVDSCCIKKSSDPELTEAINSMYRWYSRAARCYVYLSDVSTGEDGGYPSLSTWEQIFWTSRWFSRGWTLQELLAPGWVEFFSREGKRLGDKQSLDQQIHEITGIALPVLQGASLSQFSIGERFKWAQNRQTTREEDWAYCLLGIFDISMPLVYGEGREKAVSRLRREIKEGSNVNSQDTNSVLEDLLKRLPIANDAPFNSLAKQHEPSCLPETRVDLLQEIYDWADGQGERRIFWLSGLAGTGKSTIARTVARRYFDRNRLGASFFFARGGGDLGNAGKFVTSIAIQLASSVHTLCQHISDAVSEHGNITSLSLRDQWQMLVLSPLSKLEDNGHYTSYVIVVDALDECDDGRNIGMILQLLAEARAMKAPQPRFFLTSRPEIPIRYGFSQIPVAEYRDFILHDISRSTVDHDISVFLEYHLKVVAQERSLYAGWPGAEAIGHMVQIASGLFIWAATACGFIREGQRFAAQRLDIILKGSGTSVTGPEKHLNEIYTTVLKHSVSSEYTDEEEEEAYRMLRQILGSITVLSSPLSTCSLSKLLNITKEDVSQTLDDLHSVLDVPKDKYRPLRLHHPSFRDFLLNKDRCNDPNFWVDEKQAHQTLVNCCLQLMSASLKQDMCGMKLPGESATRLRSSQLEQHLPLDVQYACLYWVQHLQQSGVKLLDKDQVHKFLKEHLLHWLEALGWMRRMPDGIHSIIVLDSIALTSDCPRLYALIHDVKRFALYSRPAIEQAPLQAYSSALTFAPQQSIVREQFAGRIPGWIQKLPKVSEMWSATLATMEGHDGLVGSVAFSPDGKRLASSSEDKTVRLWDGESGGALATLEGHGRFVRSVAFSPDGKRLASSSDDNTVRLWDGESGKALATLEGHSRSVRSVVFSPDGKQLASGSGDQTVRLWDGVSGKALATLRGHSGLVISVVFSPDGKQLASSSGDKTVRLWDGELGEALTTLKGHSSFVKIVVFSPDGKRLASSSNDITVRLWDGESGEALATLEGHSRPVWSVVFSPDGRKLASGSMDGTVRLWDGVSGEALATLEGHRGSVFSTTFSPNSKQLASGSVDRTVRLWDSLSGETLATLEGHSDVITSVAFSPDGKRLASSSGDNTVRLWDGVSGKALAMREGHSYITSVAFSPDGKLLVSGSNNNTVKLWDGESGEALVTFEGHSDSVWSVAFSPDGELLTSGSGIIRLWDAESDAMLQTLETAYLVYRISIISSKHGHISVGIIRLGGAPNPTMSMKQEVPDLYVFDHWVAMGSQKLLWLPLEYRATCAAVNGQKIAIGHNSGRVSFFRFDVDSLNNLKV